MSKQPVLEQEDYRTILTTLAFYIGVDLSTVTPDKKMDDKVLEVIKKVKQIGFKRKPKLELLEYSKKAKHENEYVLQELLKIVNINEV